MNLAEYFLELCSDTQVFLGSSPVLTEKIIFILENRNHVIFPSDFSLELDDNVKLAVEMQKLVLKYNQHHYCMPIKNRC